MLTRWKT